MHAAKSGDWGGISEEQWLRIHKFLIGWHAQFLDISQQFDAAADRMIWYMISLKRHTGVKTENRWNQTVSLTSSLVGLLIHHQVKNGS